MTDISRYPVPKLENLPDDVRARIEAVAERSGFVPNVFVVLAHRPDEFRAFIDYHDAVMLRESGLTKAEKEMIVVATSAANECLYCVVAHGAILRVYLSRDEGEAGARIADQVAINYRAAALSDRQRAMLDVAVKFARAPEAVGEDDFERLRGQGFADEDIWDIAAITGLFALSNRMAHVTAMQPNHEFYGMART